MTDYATKFRRAAEAQGFEDPLDESPIENPDGWDGGEVEQTGGFVLCRIWRTYTVGEKDNDIEFEVAYGTDAYVGINAFRWDDDLEGYTYEDEVEVRRADPNTDDVKAKVAKELLQGFSPEDYR